MSFYEQLYSIRIRHGEVDRMMWNLSKKMNFAVKTFISLSRGGFFSLEG
jgi:hypothetical protein